MTNASEGAAPSPSRLIVAGLASLYLVVATMAGGSSSAGFYPAIGLQLVAAFGLAAMLVFADAPRREASTGLFCVLAAAAGLVVLQLVPLPFWLWSNLPGRDYVAEGLRLAGIAPGWRPISLAPDATLGIALSILPVVLMAAIGALSDRLVVKSLFAVVIVLIFPSMLLAVGQRLGGLDSPLYLYALSNRGEAVGFFANSNHLATFGVVALPIVAGLYASQRGGKQSPALLILLSVCIAAILAVVVLSKSLAGYGLAPIGLISIIFLLRSSRGNQTVRRAMLGVIGIGIVLVLVGAVYLMSREPGDDDFNLAAQMGRPQLWSRSLAAIWHFFPFGSGMGSFPFVYPHFEDPSLVTNVFANHAHNDVLEVFVGGGAFTMVLVAAFLWWWGRRAVAIWRAPIRSPLAEAATVATAIMMLHELVDYPLRTTALGVVFGLCCGVMARALPAVKRTDATGRAARHVQA